MKKSTLRKADLVMSILLLIFAIFVFYQASLLMHRTLNLNNEDNALWYRSAGLMPMVVSALLGISAISLFVRAWREGARFDFFTSEKVKGFFGGRELRVALFVILWLAFYIFVLLGPVEEAIYNGLYDAGVFWMIYQYLPYMLMTFVYLFVFMMAFNDVKKLKDWVISFVISLVSSALIAYLFGHVALVVLP